jgi:hypothetical protein
MAMGARRTLGTLIIRGLGLVLFSLEAIAQEPSAPEITRSTDGHVMLEAKGATRREVLEQLFTERSIRVDWVSARFADEAIQGRFAGTTGQIVRKVLGDANFIIVTDDIGNRPGGEPRISRVVVFGRMPATQIPAGSPNTGPTLATPPQPAPQVQAAANPHDLRYAPRPPRTNRSR